MTAPAPSERVCSVCDFDPENPDEGDGTVQDCLVPECPLRKAATTPTTPQYSALADELDEYAEKSIMVEGPRLAREAAAAYDTLRAELESR